MPCNQYSYSTNGVGWIFTIITGMNGLICYIVINGKTSIICSYMKCSCSLPFCTPLQFCSVERSTIKGIGTINSYDTFSSNVKSKVVQLNFIPTQNLCMSRTIYKPNHYWVFVIWTAASYKNPKWILNYPQRCHLKLALWC